MSDRTTAILPWFGSKRQLAPLIVAHLGDHNAYWEPFCGSLAVLLAKPPAPHETVNDLHGDLVNLARVLRDPDLAVALYSRLVRTLACEGLFDEAKRWWIERGEVSEAPDVERAYRYFLVSWLGRNGISGTQRYNHSYSVCWQKKGGSRASRFASAVENIPDWHERLRRVVVLRRCGLDVLARIADLPGVAIYCDPPYLEATRSKTGGGGTYQHDFDGADHARLAGLLGRFHRARVVLSYYDSPELGRLYPGWSKLSCPVANQLSRGGHDRRVLAPEVLLVNGRPAVVAPSLFDALTEAAP